MWPWGHAAVAYLVYSLFTRRSDSRPPGGLAVFALALGSQLPDLIDKPLGWNLSVLPGGRTLAHSVFFASVLIPAVYLLASQYDRDDLAVAFSIGHTSHLLSDIPLSVFRGDFQELTFLFWPVLEQPDYEEVGSILDGFLRYSMGGYEWMQIGLVVLAALVWYRDGRPGISYLRMQVERLNPTSR